MRNLKALLPLILVVAMVACGTDTPAESGGNELDMGEEGTAVINQSEGSSAQCTPDETLDETFDGIHVVLAYDAEAKEFKGTAENTTENTILAVRVMIKLSDGNQFGALVPLELASGEQLPISQPYLGPEFESWHVIVTNGGYIRED